MDLRVAHASFLTCETGREPLPYKFKVKWLGAWAFEPNLLKWKF